MSRYITPTAVFDLFLDDELVATVEAPSRGESYRMFDQMGIEGYNTLGYQGRFKTKVREHQHEPAAGNISVCVFCQQRI